MRPENGSANCLVVAVASLSTESTQNLSNPFVLELTDLPTDWKMAVCCKCLTRCDINAMLAPPNKDGTRNIVYHRNSPSRCLLIERRKSTGKGKFPCPNLTKIRKPHKHILPQCTHGANDEAAVDYTAKYHLCIVHQSVPQHQIHAHVATGGALQKMNQCNR